jgi:hypothetical protein
VNATNSSETSGAIVVPIQPSTDDAWRRFAQALREVLGALEEDEYLIVQVKRAARYVQFAGQGACGLRVESVSSFYLPEAETITDAQHQALLELGWHAPTNLPEHHLSAHPTDGSSNYFLDLAPPIDHALVAAIATATFVQIHDVGHPGSLEYQAFGEGGVSIRFPSLGIRRCAGR